MKTYLAILAFDDRTDDTKDTFEIQANSKEEARVALADIMKRCGFETELSATSEEVYIKMDDGKDIVYYGFYEE